VEINVAELYQNADIFVNYSSIINMTQLFADAIAQAS
jgi:hypothetical protein